MKIKKRQPFSAGNLQLGVLLYIGRGENWRCDAGKILGILFIFQQLRTRHSHQFDADAEDAHIFYVRRCGGAWSGEANPGWKSTRLGKDAFAKFCTVSPLTMKLARTTP